MVMVALEMPKNEEAAYEVMIENELYVQVVKGYVFQDRQFECRMDAVWGVRNVRKQMGGKIFGQHVA